jgi:UDP:flavonoid glycosyltransferase YjiC (YdhE family)
VSRIVLTTIGSFGDLHPKIAIAFELRHRGHDVVFATHREYQNKIEGKCLFSPVEIVAHLTRSALGEAQKAG